MMSNKLTHHYGSQILAELVSCLLWFYIKINQKYKKIQQKINNEFSIWKIKSRYCSSGKKLFCLTHFCLTCVWQMYEKKHITPLKTKLVALKLSNVVRQVLPNGYASNWNEVGCTVTAYALCRNWTILNKNRIKKKFNWAETRVFLLYILYPHTKKLCN